MTWTVPPDVEALVAQHVASGRYRTEGDVLRSAMRALTEVDEDLAAVEQALQEWRNGDAGVPLHEAMEAVRTRTAPGPGA